MKKKTDTVLIPAKEIITALKIIEDKTGDLLRKFEDAYEKGKNDHCATFVTIYVTLLNYMLIEIIVK